MSPNGISDKILRSAGKMDGLRISIRPKDLNYKIEELKVMIVKLILDEKSEVSGECHIKCKVNVNSGFLVNFISNRIPEYEVGEVIPDSKIKLEYPVFIKTNDPMSIICMFDNLKRVDNSLSWFLNRKED